ncbi:hypothetical protein [Thermomonas sp.]|jgi:Na+-translocating ferredoxin:NAD+ oxidoreductase RnfC subunit|uniref:hypothetical protein n=1 Tax=Thermomonas sp. TaxID=1971895 RepID=UPI002D1FB9F3|nr:hypothetical protein [Thermomonas sp.]
MATGCPHCQCQADAVAHRLLQALHTDDVDVALELGLLDAQPCPDCAPTCTARLQEARDARHFALAARERHRARAQRLARIQSERDAARRPPPAPSIAQAPVLPSSAADALARALAKAKARHI